MNLEEQISAYKEITNKIHELERQKKELGDAIMLQMQEKTLQVAGFVVKRYSRLSIQLSIEEARTLGAVKLEEIIDRAKIKALFQMGKPLKGVSVAQYIQVQHQKETAS